MKFKAGDRVKYVGQDKKWKGCSGVIMRICPILHELCVVVKISDRNEEHIFARYLKLNQKNQQLLFNFMD